MIDQELPLREQVALGMYEAKRARENPHFDVLWSDIVGEHRDGWLEFADVALAVIAAQPRPEMAEIEARLNAVIRGYYAPSAAEYEADRGALIALIERALAVPAVRESYVEDDVDQAWQEFWRPIIAPDGVIDIGQIKRELFDFSELMGNAAEVYEHVTGGQITKVNTLPSVVRSVSDDYATKMCEEAEGEAGPADHVLVPVDALRAVTDELLGHGEEYRLHSNEELDTLRALLPERGDEDGDSNG